MPFNAATTPFGETGIQASFPTGYFNRLYKRAVKTITHRPWHLPTSLHETFNGFVVRRFPIIFSFAVCQLASLVPVACPFKLYDVCRTCSFTGHLSICRRSAH